MSDILHLDGIHTYYGRTCVLRGVSLRVPRGAAVALLGRNGMGKTTTIRSIVGFTPPRKGSIQYGGKEITGLAPNRISRLGIGLVPQGRRIFPSLNVQENLTLAERHQNGSSLWNLAKIHELFPILKTRAATKGTSLSGGEQQMLAIGRALMTNPDLLIMDEPSEGLAPIIVNEVARTLNNIKQTGVSILIVEQNLHFALSVADYVYIMSSGAIVHDSLATDLADNEELITKYLGVSSAYC